MMHATALERPNEMDVALGYLHGLLPPAQAPVAMAGAREACELVVLEALLNGRCFVSFSGGRDSSAVLALAVALARRHGLEPPIPVTKTYPRDSPGYEGEWQERVLTHLGVKDWVRFPASHARDALGDEATRSLRRCGLVWPPMAHDKGPLFALARGGQLLTGEGGDEVLGNQRITPLVGTYRRRLRPSRKVLAAVGMALAPGRVRRAVLRHDYAGTHPWLRGEAAKNAMRVAVDVQAGRPLAWDRGVRQALQHRSAVVGLRTLDHMAAHEGVTLHHPLRDPRFVHAFAAAGGRWGYLGRSEAMRVLFGDLLPSDILTRSTKATFNDAVFGAGARAWARDWDGSGLRPDLIDSDALRGEWLSRRPHGGTLLLLQATWLRARELPASGACAAYPAIDASTAVRT